MKYLHKIFSWLGYSLGGAKACKKYGCKEYCGYSVYERMKFYNMGMGSWAVVKKKFYLIECENGHLFRHKPIRDDGINKCPHCEGKLGEPFVGAEDYVIRLKSIGLVREEVRRAERTAQREKYNKTNARTLSIDVDASVDKLKLKLKAIAKHADALANELDAIDNAEPCGECGSINITTWRADGVIFSATCDDCGHESEVENK